MRSLIFLIFALLAVPAFGQLRAPPGLGTYLEVNHTVEDDAPFLRLTNNDAIELFTLEQNGSLVLRGQATIDFGRMTSTHGPLRGYIYVRAGGQEFVIPAFQLIDDGTVWRVQPLQP